VPEQRPAAVDVIDGGPPYRAPRVLPWDGPRRTWAVVGFGAGLLVAAVGISLLPSASPSGSASASLTCNGPLPERFLSINLSWASPADEVTLDLGDGQRRALDPDPGDAAALSDAIRHQYSRPGTYQVVLTARRGSTTASAACAFSTAELGVPGLMGHDRGH
jgi:hypothetical protein